MVLTFCFWGVPTEGISLFAVGAPLALCPGGNRCLPGTQVGSSPLDATGETRMLFLTIRFINGLDRDLP